MALKLGELVAFLKLDKGQFTAGLAKAKAEMQAAGAAIDQSSAAAAFRTARSWITGSSQSRTRLTADIDASKKKLRELADEYGRTGDKSLLKDMSRERAQIKQFEAALDGLARGALTAVVDGLRTGWSTVSSFASGVASFASSLWGLVVVLLAVFAVVTLLLPLVSILGAALGALPALAVGAVAGIGALGLGFMGLASHFQKTASAGTSVVDRAYQIAQAERHVRDANMEVLASQEALNAARLTAAQRMRDLTRNLAGAHLDEESAIAAVASAQRDLDAARLTENPDRIKAADLALRQQQQSLADVRDRVTDLTAEQADAARKGVEGSDVVRAALDRQRKAVEGVTDAQHNLEVAQRPLAGAAQQMAKLAPSALEFVAAIKSLKPAFDSLQLDVQQKLFAGVGGEIKSLAAAWLPTLHERVGGMATMFNGLFKDLAKSAKKPEFIANISVGMASVQGFIERIGKSLTGPFMDAFGRLSKAAAPFITALGDGIAGIVESFSAWIKKADESGSLKTFFEKASEFLKEVFAIGKDVASIIGSVVSIFFKAEDKNPKQTQIGRFREGMDKLAAWFKDPENQNKIAEFFGKLESFLLWVKDTAIPKVQEWIKKAGEWADKLKGWADKAGEFKDRVVEAVDKVSAAWNSLKNAPANMWDALKDGFKAAMNWIIGKWNGLKFTMPQGDLFGVKVGGGTLQVPQIPLLANGGFIPATPGGRVVRMAEAGQDEIASPVDQLRRIVAEELARAQGDQPGVIENHIHIGDEVTRVVRTEVRESNRALKRGVTAGAGSR